MSKFYVMIDGVLTGKVSGKTPEAARKKILAMSPWLDPDTVKVPSKEEAMAIFRRVRSEMQG